MAMQIDFHATIRLLFLIFVVFLSLLYLKIKEAEGKPVSFNKEQANAALQELRQWGAFLIGIQGSAIAIMGFFFEKMGGYGDNGKSNLTEDQATVGIFAIILFGVSIIAATWLLGAIPSIMLRVSGDDSKNRDFFHIRLFEHGKWWPQVGPITGLQYGLFIAGVIFFSIFVYMRLDSISSKS